MGNQGWGVGGGGRQETEGVGSGGGVQGLRVSKASLFVFGYGRNRHKRAIHGALWLALPSMARHFWFSGGMLKKL